MKTNDEEIVAVYGTLMAGEANAHWANCGSRVDGIVTGRLYDTGYGFPAFFPDPSHDKHVSVELVFTDKDGLAQMDRLEGYPRIYRRERITVRTSYGEEFAWVYVMNNLPVGAKIIKCGDWRVYRKAKGCLA